MANYSSLDKLFEKISKDVAKTLANQVAKKVIEVEKEMIQTYVYDAYPEPLYPKEYRRQKTKRGGLLNKDSFKKTFKNPLTMVIRNIRSDISKLTGERRDVAEIVEHGHYGSKQGYEYPVRNAGFMPARPFTQKTRDELQKTNKHVDAMKVGLRAKGYNVL